MNNLKELTRKYEELGKEIERLKDKEEWPRNGDTAYVIDGGGVIYTISFHIDCHSEYLKMGSVFRTKEEAEAKRDATLVVEELRRQPGARKFFVREWNYSLSINLMDEAVCGDAWRNIDEGWQSIYFHSHEAAVRAIEAVGKERILKAARYLAMGESIVQTTNTAQKAINSLGN